MSEDASFEDLVRIHRKINSAKKQMAAEYEAKLAELEEQLKLVANAIKDFMLSNGDLKTIRTAHGTVIRGTTTRYTTRDWEGFHEFVIQNNALDLLEKRIAQRNMSTFLEENPTLVPPGLDASTEYTITVRKPS